MCRTPPISRSFCGDVTSLLEKAQGQINEADTEERVLEFIKTYESVLEIDPYNYEALWSLGRWYWFVGVHSEDAEQKKKYYADSIKCCEQGMYTNPQFRDLVDKGEKLWDACRVLSRREIASMNYWYAANGSYWSECLNPIVKLVRLIHAGRSRKVLTRMLEIDPNWGGGSPYLWMAIRNVFMPRIFGGDLEKTEEFFDKAIEAGPNWVATRIARARYLHTKKNDREAFKKVLEWVIAQDPRKLDSPYPANVKGQQQAKEILTNIDDYF